MPTYFHVTASANRTSIERHGLDWRRMADTHGIAGSPAPELDGVFLCRDLGEAGFFGALAVDDVDIWAVHGVAAEELLDSPEGFAYLARPVPATDVRLHERDRRPARASERSTSTAYRSSLTIVVHDGSTLPDDEARDQLNGRISDDTSHPER